MAGKDHLIDFPVILVIDFYSRNFQQMYMDTCFVYF